LPPSSRSRPLKGRFVANGGDVFGLDGALAHQERAFVVSSSALVRDEGILVGSDGYVAANIMDLAPHAVRPAVRAAFSRARELGLTVEMIADDLDDAEERKRANG
jgi:hypothetical protein